MFSPDPGGGSGGQPQPEGGPAAGDAAPLLSLSHTLPASLSPPD